MPASGGLCRLHGVTSRQSPSDWSPKRSKGWTHYQKSCNSTFATNDNWYNLLCESRVDCPDINSDCLSGRCLCRLGFKFDQAEKKCVVTKLSKWHSERCWTDDDCDAPHATCYKRVCRCEPGFFYTTQDTCTNTCSTDDMQDSFTDYPDSALRGHYLDSWDGLSLEDCNDRCQTNKRCLTFDFKVQGGGGLCRLHNVTAHESPSYWAPKMSKGWTHYQRSCKSIFASHDTWYNLLCHNKIDCPDPYSDCLSGRCLCHFAFNEAEKKCVVARTCQDWQAAGGMKSGVYTIQPPYYNGPLTVWCDMDTVDGGWIVFQRRRDFSVDFNRSWTEYKNGFGNISGDFWLGLWAIYELAWFTNTRLRVDLVAESGRRYWAQYTFFYLSYTPYFGLCELRDYSGDAGDGLINSNSFRTYDDDSYGCVTATKGPWWYPYYDCASNSDLNNPDRRLMTWADIGRVTFSEMKMKPEYPRR